MYIRAYPGEVLDRPTRKNSTTSPANRLAISRSPACPKDRRHWTVAHLRDNAPLEYFHYIATRGKLGASSRRCLRWTESRLCRWSPSSFASVTGLSSSATYPVRAMRSRPGGCRRCCSSLAGRDVWALHLGHEWLANRGYAVLNVNYLGSTGFRKAFVNAANLEWAGKMHDDLVDAVDWAIAQDIADPDHVAIMGGSYGGYAALVGVTFHSREVRLRGGYRRDLQPDDLS
jgi:prolyl oligopeptidase family protein